MKRNITVNNSNQHQGQQIFSSYFQTMIIFVQLTSNVLHFVTLCPTSVVIVCTGENEGRK